MRKQIKPAILSMLLVLAVLALVGCKQNDASGNKQEGTASSITTGTNQNSSQKEDAQVPESPSDTANSSSDPSRTEDTQTSEDSSNSAESNQNSKETESAPFNETITWTLENGVLTIFGEGPMNDYPDGETPWHAELKDVEGLAKIKEIVISEGITKIGQLSFGMCLNLKKVTIPDTVTHIGSGAFAFCSIWNR